MAAQIQVSSSLAQVRQCCGVSEGSEPAGFILISVRLLFFTCYELVDYSLRGLTRLFNGEELSVR